MVQDFGIVGSLEVNSGEFTEFGGVLTEKVSGVKAVWILMDGKALDVDWFGFERCSREP